MKTYADTSFLVSLYLDDDHTDAANAWMKRHADPLPFTPLHRHEFRNAIRLAAWRKQIDPAQRRDILRLMDEDLKEGYLKHQPVAWTEALRDAERIGEAQTEQTGARALDLLHIGIAIGLGATDFLTFDSIQRKAASGAGLECGVI